MPFKKRFTFSHTNKGKIEIIPHFTETQKLGSMGFGGTSKRPPHFKPKKKKPFQKTKGNGTISSIGVRRITAVLPLLLR